MTERAFKRVKFSTLALLVLGTASYFANNMQESLNSYISFVDAQDELLIEQFPEHDLNEQGKLAMADFTAWYGLENFDDLDEEYDAVKELIEKDKKPVVEQKMCITLEEIPVMDKAVNWQGTDYKCISRFNMANGYVEEYLQEDEEQCVSSLFTLRGFQLINKNALIFVYLIFLMYLFIGISIIADKFMEAIEVITSTTERVEAWDPTGKKKFFIEVPVWNATIANLSLMALGSSAPEIFLNVLGTASAIDKPQEELGPSTIVGSAAFNFLFITAVCIPAVDKPKKIFDMGVFLTTSVFSIFAYVWLYLCLTVISPGKVTRVEAWITIGFFLLLLILAFGADKYNQIKVERAKSDDEKKQEQLRQQKSGVKAKLRETAKLYGDERVIQIAHGSVGDSLDKGVCQDTIDALKEYFETEVTKEITAHEIHEALKPDTLFERFAARKAAGTAPSRDFLSVKGQVAQAENELASSQQNRGPGHSQVRFKCLHYSVAESSGSVDVTIQKVVKGSEFSFGIRTVADTANESSEFQPIDKILQFNRTQNEQTVSVTIFDNNEWQPDLEFIIELYDASNQDNEAFEEYDTKTRVTIIDEDFPGNLGFQNTNLTVQSNREFIEVNLERTEGSDGKVSCIVRTLDSQGGTMGASQAAMAIENEHFIPVNQKVEFLHGETEKQIQIPLINQNNKILGEFLIEAGKFEWLDPTGKNGSISFGQNGLLSTNFQGNYENGTWEVNNTEEITIKFAKQGERTLQMSKINCQPGQKWQVIRPKKNSDASLMIENHKQVFELPEAEDIEDLMLKVAIESPEPQGVKVSKKNIALVSITSDFELEDQVEDAQLLHFFMEEQKPSWGRLFKKAIMLGPQIEDNIEIEHVELSQAIMHFLTITWNVIFAFVPPTHWGGGWPAFIIALSFIGLITMVVGDAAILFGCALGIPQAVTGITLVALGTSLPDTFASMIAAKNSEYADSAVGNVTGSNSVNVFLGLGLPWVMASTYMEGKGKVFLTPPGNLAYSVIVFIACSLVAFLILGIRRYTVHGELGGPKTSAYASSAAFVTLWMIYITLSIVKATSGWP